MRAWMSWIERSGGINTLEALPIHVSTTVDQTGDDGLALQIDDAGGRCGVRHHCRILADGDDPLAGDGDRLGDRSASGHLQKRSSVIRPSLPPSCVGILVGSRLAQLGGRRK
jgi:hypothetical protein